MTSASPEFVKYTYYARVGSTDLPVTNIIASMDRDRKVYCMATIECDWVDNATFTALDPRASAKVEWNVEQFNEAGTRIGYLPNVASSGTPVKASMWVRDVERDPVNMTTTIRLAGGESMMLDKKRISGVGIDSGVWYIDELIYWLLDDVFGSYNITFNALMSNPIANDDNRWLMSGENFLDPLEVHMGQINCRLMDDWGIRWYTRERNDVNGTLELATYPGVTGTDPIVYGYREHVTREGDWYDGVLIRYNTPAGPVEYRRSSSGVNTRGFVYVSDRYPATGNDAAEMMEDRAIVRGYDIDIDARCRFDFDAMWEVEVTTPGPITKGALIRSVEWDIAANRMRIRGQSGDPV